MAYPRSWMKSNQGLPNTVIRVSQLIVDSRWKFGNVNCWNRCNEKGGQCPDFCGVAGFCCSKDKLDKNDDCPKDALEGIV